MTESIKNLTNLMAKAVQSSENEIFERNSIPVLKTKVAKITKKLTSLLPQNEELIQNQKYVLSGNGFAFTEEFREISRDFHYLANNMDDQKEKKILKKHNIFSSEKTPFREIRQPQKNFINRTDNDEKEFVSFLNTKPNSNDLFETIKNKKEVHPYTKEIKFFKKNIRSVETKEHPGKDSLKLPKPIEETPYQWINNKENLLKLLSDLKKESEIAIDLENHDDFCYLGFICVIQISTLKMDYLIDAVALHDELQILNEVTTDPKITKVFHSANCDVVWLQRDFSVYIVNLFDTSIACQKLSYERMGLKYLLEKFCGQTKESFYTLSDWRTRPLTIPMIQYARKDSHYLLYIKQCLVEELAKKSFATNESRDLIKEMMSSGADLCLKQYKKPKHDLKNIISFAKRYKINKKDPLYLFLFYKLFLWRDSKARELDVSWKCILTIRDIHKVVNSENFKLGKHFKFYFMDFEDELSQLRKNSVDEFYGSKVYQKIFEKEITKMTPKKSKINNQNNTTVSLDQKFNKNENEKTVSKPNEERIHRNKFNKNNVFSFKQTKKTFSGLKKDPPLQKYDFAEISFSSKIDSSGPKKDFKKDTKNSEFKKIKIKGQEENEIRNKETNNKVNRKEIKKPLGTKIDLTTERKTVGGEAFEEIDLEKTERKIFIDLDEFDFDRNVGRRRTGNVFKSNRKWKKK